MPQPDKYRERIVPIEFEQLELFKISNIEDRFKLVLVTSGNATILVNNSTLNISSPSVVCLSIYDEVKILNSYRFSAKSFSFEPEFLNNYFTFDKLKKNEFIHLKDQHDNNLLKPFLNHSMDFGGVLNIPPSMYLRIKEWLDIIGKEILTQSDCMWTCRIRRYLIQTLFLIEDSYITLSNNGFNQNRSSYEDNYAAIALEYIHANYQQEITLETLSKITNLNRTSLNKRFKSKTGKTLIDYLVHHRLKVSCEALTHTNLKLSEIAEACGFMYDTYFIKQFKAKLGLSPSKFRRKSLTSRN